MEIIVLLLLLFQLCLGLFILGAIGWAIFTYLHFGFFIAYLLVFAIPVMGAIIYGVLIKREATRRRNILRSRNPEIWKNRK